MGIPSALSNRKLTEHELSSMNTCKWTMTGPQTSAVTEYPARYLTPKTGTPAYNVDTRGILYLRKDADGNDDTDVKILHIYRSEKVSRRGMHPVETEAHASKKKSERVSKPKKVKISVPKESSKKFSRHAWSEAEDCQLRELAQGFTSLNQRIRWVKVSNEMIGRSGKQCRGEYTNSFLLCFVLQILFVHINHWPLHYSIERWMYQLQPGLNREEFTLEEDELLARLVETMGTKWIDISDNMPGRSDMDVKNRWNRRERGRKKQEERKGKMNNTQSFRKKINNAACGGSFMAGTDALISLCDVALAKEQEENIEHSMEGGDTSTTASSECPEVGMRARVRFEGGNGDYTFYGASITKVSSELEDMAAAMDIDGLANAVANGAHAHSSSTDQSFEMNVYSIGNVDASAAPQTKITLMYDDGSLEECVFPDPDIQLVANNLSEEEMSLSNELLNLNVSLSLRELHSKKRKHSDDQMFPAGVKSSELHSDCVPLETVRGLLLGNLDPIELATRLLPSDEVLLVRKKWKKSD